MPEEWSEIVEVHDVERDVSLDAADAITQGPARAPLVILDRWPWWRRNGPVNRVLTVVAAAAFGVAAVAAYGAVKADPGTQFFIDQKLVAAPVIAVDALGCPRTVICVTAAVPSALLAAVTSAAPTGRITLALQTVDARSGRVYRREIDVVAGQATMRVVSQCVPGSGPIVAQPPILTIDTHALAGDDPPIGLKPVGLNRLTEVRAGRRGCSLFAEADTSRWDYRLGDDSASEIVGRIAADPVMMVTP